MNRTLTTGALLTSLLIGACATSPMPPKELLAARSTVRNAQLDPTVQAQAALELKKATDSLNKAEMLLTKGEPIAEVANVAYLANQQAKTAMVLAQAKSSEIAISDAEVERERARADMMAQRAQSQTASARASVSQAQQQTSLLQQQLDELQAKQTERGLLVTLGDVLFETNKAEIRPRSHASLRKLADFLKQYPDRRVVVEGYTDNVGDASHNEMLSRRRAEAVDAALVRMGVPPQRVEAVGYGEEFPIADNTTSTNRALNRRVEIYIAENDQPVKARR